MQHAFWLLYVVLKEHAFSADFVAFLGVLRDQKLLIAGAAEEDR
jgi:hypothetical protein